MRAPQRDSLVPQLLLPGKRGCVGQQLRSTILWNIVLCVSSDNCGFSALFDNPLLLNRRSIILTALRAIADASLLSWGPRAKNLFLTTGYRKMLPENRHQSPKIMFIKSIFALLVKIHYCCLPSNPHLLARSNCNFSHNLDFLFRRSIIQCT